MTVFVESNFILEIALGQEQAAAAETLLQRAELGEIRLAIPAFSLSEPFGTVTQRARTRDSLVGQLRRQIGDLGRSQQRRGDVRSIEVVPVVLGRIEALETEDLLAVTDRILRVAAVIHLSSSVLRQAVVYRSRFGFRKIQDALIFAAIVGRLKDREFGAPHYFVTKDKEDFGDPAISVELRSLECDVLHGFSEVLIRLEEPLPE